MPIPKPSSDNYDSPHDGAYLWEDFWADQERFHEATDKEVKRQKEIIGETLAGRLEGVAVAIRDLLGEPDFINHEELDVGAMQQALGELESVISRLENERRR